MWLCEDSLKSEPDHFRLPFESQKRASLIVFNVELAILERFKLIGDDAEIRN